jgi:adenosylcobinamide-GDP ribazoletransferase
MLKRFLIALQFLTIVPVRVGGEVTEEDMARSSAFFPLVGLVQGVLLVAADILLGRVFHPDLTLALVLLVLVLSNGGFHLDGLSDTFDALATKGGRERRLEAMKDSATGAIGVTAIVFALGIKYLSLKSVSNLTTYDYYAALLFMPVLSKWAMLVMMRHGVPAREEGLGRVFMSGARTGGLIAATVITAALLSAPVLAVPLWAGAMRHVFNFGALALVYMFGLLLTRFFRRRFGGLTGDTLGAGGELAEILFLWTAIVWSRLYTL